MNLNLRPEIISELRRLERILTGKIQLSPEDTRIMIYNYARDSDYYADVFMLNVRLLFSKCKGHPETTSIVFQAVIEIAIKSGRADLNQRIADCRDFVANSSLPEDNLYLAYNSSHSISNTGPTKSRTQNPGYENIKDILIGKDTLRGIVSNGYFWIITFVIGLILASVSFRDAYRYIKHMFQY